MNADALIFDLDGTILDTNRQHARAWAMALKEFGYGIPADRIVIEIGKGGDKLTKTLIGEEAENEDGEELRSRHGELFRELIEEEGVDVFDGVDAAFEWAESRDLMTAVATASNEDDLEKVLDIAGMDLRERADVVVTDSDVERSKPHPDTVSAAVKKLGMSPAQCVMIGDTPYDAIACRRAGVTCIGVCTGVHDAAAMHQVGARVSYDNLAHLTPHLDEAMARAAPGQESLTTERLDHLMKGALRQAERALESGNMPVGCLIMDGTGEVVATAYNRARQERSAISHAEILALQRVPSGARTEEMVLVTSLEPCLMCFGAAMEAGIGTIVYALDAPPNGGVERSVVPENHYMPRVVGGVRNEDSRELLRKWAHLYSADGFVERLLQDDAEARQFEA